MTIRRSRFTILATAAGLLVGLGLAAGETASAAQDCKKSTFPATGVTTPSTADTLGGAGTAVADDGTVQAGGPLRYRDNGDGTISDLNTGLMWEKKSIDGSLHDVNLALPWSAVGERTVWDWLAEVNAEGPKGKGFAGYSDWRLPNVRELQSLVDYSVVNPTGSSSGPGTATVDPIFNAPGMFNGWTLDECSVTGGTPYMSSTHSASGTEIWVVNFSACRVNDGGVLCGATSIGGWPGLARAVRGGCVDRH